MKCQICGKGSNISNTTKELRGHVNPTGKQRKQPNLQKIKIPENAKLPKGADESVKGKKVKACTDCIKAIYARAK